MIRSKLFGKTSNWIGTRLSHLTKLLMITMPENVHMAMCTNRNLALLIYLRRVFQTDSKGSIQKVCMHRLIWLIGVHIFEGACSCYMVIFKPIHESHHINWAKWYVWPENARRNLPTHAIWSKPPLAVYEKYENRDYPGREHCRLTTGVRCSGNVYTFPGSYWTD